MTAEFDSGMCQGTVSQVTDGHDYQNEGQWGSSHAENYGPKWCSPSRNQWEIGGDIEDGI